MRRPCDSLDLSNLDGKNQTFLIIGAAKRATASLAKYLQHHLDVFVPSTKELNCFANPLVRQKVPDWYLGNFRTPLPIRGRASTSYTAAVGEESSVPESIYRFLGPVKLVYLVRDPMRLLISHYRHRIQRGVAALSIFEYLSTDAGARLLWQGLCHHQLSL